MKTISCMNIDENLLYSYGAEDRIYKKKEVVFKEEDHALYYFQIGSGKVKLNNYSEEGKEFIHNILGKNQSFGEAMLFLSQDYPVNAVCLEASRIIRLPKNNFLEMIDQHPHLSLEMNACFSQEIYYKLKMMQSLASLNPMHRLKGLMDYLKSFHHEDCHQCFHIAFTRQQIANLTGLRVETVIRNLKKMEKEGILSLKDRKILY
ncbi:MULTISPECIES: Crp/Fnr family transcriptional regulator [Chryseobacterium]|nr:MULTISPECIES: Crp/Fnr family transcriptional regulator [Chryseobacterium]MDH5033327.1 Crp/Fnr family transcriptional regulator [Chryseobacterium cucumeris]RKE81389.1 CRP-like cAMP-binding protein [Chryseobacterium sp. AG363]WNI37498.1 Crp/Fnr family transcriptional regulator [Chryseobacterium sp. SG20098]